jgi:hypothetical protein
MFHTPAHKFVPSLPPLQSYGEVTEINVRSGRFDSKGREIGFTIGFRDNGSDFRAYVQNARRVTAHEWQDFGVQQRSKSFSSQAEATRWAWATANERIAKLKG